MKIFSALKKSKVYFHGSFYGGHRGHCGREIKIKYSFDWADSQWIIPSVYVCREGLVIDYCRRIEPSDIKEFIDKWNLNSENFCNFTKEERLRIEYDNPMEFDFRSAVNLNGTELKLSHSSSVTYNPCLPEATMSETKDIVKRYGIDSDYGWTVYRCCYPWEKKQKIREFSVTMAQEKVNIPGERFSVHAAGDTFCFTYGSTEHTLTVREYENHVIDVSGLNQNDTEYPTDCAVMTYTVTPEIPDGTMSLIDCDDGDSPRTKQKDRFQPESSAAASIGIIGGADGPTSITVGQNPHGKYHTSFSSLHFDTVNDVEWLMMFHEKKFENITFTVKRNF